MARQKGSGIEDLILLPWWVSLGFAGLVYIGSGIASAAQMTNTSYKIAAEGPHLTARLV